jgi:hypothetical protein
MYRIVIVSFMAVFLCVALAFAQEAQKGPSGNPEKYQQEFKRMQEEMRKLQEQELEQLKQTSPQLYQERKVAIERQTKLQAILSDFQAGKLTAEQSESQLFPLMKAEMRPELEGLNEGIARIERQLAFLKKAKQDPNLLVRRRVGMMLGKQQPEPEELFGLGY